MVEEVTHGLWKCFECTYSNECWTMNKCRKFVLDTSLSKDEINKRGEIQNAIADWSEKKNTN